MADFDVAISLNLRTVLATTEAAIPEMRARGGGALLYTASTSGLVGSGFSPVYSMAKFAGAVDSGDALSIAKKPRRSGAISKLVGLGYHSQRLPPNCRHCR